MENFIDLVGMPVPKEDKSNGKAYTAEDTLNKNIKIKKIDYAANTLAFVGDAVFTLFIRKNLAQSNLKAGQLTKKAARLVSATMQSQMLDKIVDILTAEESDIVRRCRNAKTNNHAKNASITDYHRATGLEGLIGHLYLTNNQRLNLILDTCLKDITVDF